MGGGLSEVFKLVFEGGKSGSGLVKWRIGWTERECLEGKDGTKIMDPSKRCYKGKIS